MNEDKINKICLAVGRLEGTINGIAEFQDKMWKLYGKQDDRIGDLEKKPSAIKAVIWTGSIIGMFIMVATLMARFL